LSGIIWASGDGVEWGEMVGWDGMGWEAVKGELILGLGIVGVQSEEVAQWSSSPLE